MNWMIMVRRTPYRLNGRSSGPFLFDYSRLINNFLWFGRGWKASALSDFMKMDNFGIFL